MAKKLKPPKRLGDIWKDLHRSEIDMAIACDADMRLDGKRFTVATAPFMKWEEVCHKCRGNILDNIQERKKAREEKLREKRLYSRA